MLNEVDLLRNKWRYVMFDVEHFHCLVFFWVANFVSIPLKESLFLLIILDASVTENLLNAKVISNNTMTIEYHRLESL